MVVLSFDAAHGEDDSNYGYRDGQREREKWEKEKKEIGVAWSRLGALVGLEGTSVESTSFPSSDPWPVQLQHTDMCTHRLYEEHRLSEIEAPVLTTHVTNSSSPIPIRE